MSLETLENVHNSKFIISYLQFHPSNYVLELKQRKNTFLNNIKVEFVLHSLKKYFKIVVGGGARVAQSFKRLT